MSLIFLALSGCNSPTQRVVDEIVTSWREQRTPLNIDETLTINSAHRAPMRGVRAKRQGASPAGSKAGRASAPAQARFRANDAVAGMPLKEGALQSAGTVNLREARGLYVEVEIAMHIINVIEWSAPSPAALNWQKPS